MLACAGPPLRPAVVARQAPCDAALAPPSADAMLGTVTVFAAGADGDVAPIRVLAGPRTGLRQPNSLALDRQDHLYVANAQLRVRDDTVRVFASDRKGDAAPDRVLAGPRTRIASPSGLAVDRRGRLYVGNQDAVTVYERGARGDATPLRTLAGGNRHDGMAAPGRLAFGRGDSLYVRSLGVLAIYAPRASEAVEPVRYVARFDPGPPFTTVDAPRLIALDRHDTLYAVSGDTVLVYPPDYKGTGEPMRRIAGARTGLRGIKDIALDRRGWLYVALTGRRWDRALILVYPPGASGDVAPARTIHGCRTRLAMPTRIVLDRAGRLYVANALDPVARAAS